MPNPNSNISRKEWWRQKRLRYNLALILAGFLAFILYCLLGEILIAPYDPLGFEITIFTLAFQGFGYIIAILLANVCFILGMSFEERINKKDDPVIRNQIYQFGFWLSVALPFLIPAGIVVEYFIHYS